MPAAGIGPVKRMLRSLDLGAFSEALKTAVHTSNGEFRNEVLAIAELQKIVLTDS